ncbi:MAG TPA: phospholipase C, phosphocholine-specific [Pseudonocardiaceae bacterium]|nr:phospholipase C, phosphocholine-specific [Pseudonocardiaceae bacterium]
MSDLSRRGFLGAAAAVTGAAVVGTTAAPAAAASPGAPGRHGRHGDIRDIKHVMVVMQENRSVDHYFGSLRGVRGFGDRATITLPGGLSVFQQPTTAPGSPVTATQFPWRLSDAPPSAYPAGNQPPTAEVGAQGYGGTSHSWDDQHGAWFGGQMNGWVFAKGGPTTLGYLDRDDIPFEYALADAYTVGDAYHCSVLSATGPNRTYLCSGTVDAQQKFSDFVAFNGGDELGKNLLWESYAETLQQAGVTWKLYQGTDNFGDNGLEYFASFARFDPEQGGTPAPGNVLYDNGVATVPEPVTGVTANADNLANAIRADVLAGTLAQVTWVVTNQAFSEHPDGAPGDGAYFVKGVLDALNADPDVFNSTLVVIDYDENDGQFDHVPPPVPAAGTKDEFFFEPTGALVQAGLTQPVPVGLGFRVPLILISPWTRGGWVTSEVADHTSVIQFLEKWTGALGKPAVSPNISAWRRGVCGDLVDAFDFHAPVFGMPDLPAVSVIGDLPGGAFHPPTTTNRMPVQEPGAKRARALPVQPNANLDGFTFGADGSVTANLAFGNNGPHVRKSGHFAVYDNVSPARSLADYPARFPGQFTVDPSTTVWNRTTPGTVAIANGPYDLTVVGPNRFLRHFTGDVTVAGLTAEVEARFFDAPFTLPPHLLFDLINTGRHAVTFTVTANQYSKQHPKSVTVRAHGRETELLDGFLSHSWYDVTVTLSGDRSWTRRYAGHIEDGNDSVTG